MQPEPFSSDQCDPCWTPDLVRARLIEAVTWVRYYGGPVGPAQIRSSMPTYRPTLDDHLDEGWGLPENADDGDEDATRRKVMAMPPSPDKVEQLIDALTWVASYVARNNHGSAKMLSLWLWCRVYRHDFRQRVKAAKIQPSHAYRLRDRALMLIATGLDADGKTP